MESKRSKSVRTCAAVIWCWEDHTGTASSGLFLLGRISPAWLAASYSIHGKPRLGCVVGGAGALTERFQAEFLLESM